MSYYKNTLPDDVDKAHGFSSREISEAFMGGLPNGVEDENGFINKDRLESYFKFLLIQYIENEARILPERLFEKFADETVFNVSLPRFALIATPQGEVDNFNGGKLGLHCFFDLSVDSATDILLSNLDADNDKLAEKMHLNTNLTRFIDKIGGEDFGPVSLKLPAIDPYSGRKVNLQVNTNSFVETMLKLVNLLNENLYDSNKEFCHIMQICNHLLERLYQGKIDAKTLAKAVIKLQKFGIEKSALMEGSFNKWLSQYEERNHQPIKEWLESLENDNEQSQ